MKLENSIIVRATVAADTIIGRTAIAIMGGRR
jgi:hypothetical protein